ncbi:MAG: hypothetical protein GY713_06525 [Actinomycetia bacterium]|nr:hypothetical protein [Actinomycetes bacterium]
MTWNSATGATSYEVWRHTANNATGATRIAPSVTGTQYDDFGASIGVTYYYWVKSKNATVTSGFSDSDSGYRGEPPPPPPTGVSASDGTFTDRVRVTWNSATGATSYEVWRHTTNNSSGATRIAPSVTGTLYDDFGVSTGVTYYYWVKSKNSGGTSGFSGSNSGYRAVGPSQDPEGTLDRADCTLFAGWARDPDNTVPLQVRFYKGGPAGGGGTLITTVTADLYRSDLPYADKDHGFSFATPSAFVTGQPETVYAYARDVDSSGGQTGDRWQLVLSPKTMTCGTPNVPPGGTLDVATCSTIAGWARDPNNTAPIRVHIYTGGPVGGGGTFFANVLADRYRGDLPFADKYHGFTIPVPAGSIAPGTLIYAYGINIDAGGNPAGPNVQLDLSPRPLTCP